MSMFSSFISLLMFHRPTIAKCSLPWFKALSRRQYVLSNQKSAIWLLSVTRCKLLQRLSNLLPLWLEVSKPYFSSLSVYFYTFLGRISFFCHIPEKLPHSDWLRAVKLIVNLHCTAAQSNILLATTLQRREGGNFDNFVSMIQLRSQF